MSSCIPQQDEKNQVLTTYVWYRQVRERQIIMFYTLFITGVIQKIAILIYCIINQINQLANKFVIAVSTICFELCGSHVFCSSSCLYIFVTKTLTPHVFAHKNRCLLLFSRGGFTHLAFSILEYFRRGQMNSWCGTQKTLMKSNKFLYLLLMCGCPTSSSMSCKNGCCW